MYVHEVHMDKYVHTLEHISKALGYAKSQATLLINRIKHDI